MIVETGGLDSLGRVLTPPEVAAFLRVSVASVCRAAEELGGIRVGEECVFFEAALCERLRQKLFAKPETRALAPPVARAAVAAGEAPPELEDRHDIFGGVGESVP